MTVVMDQPVALSTQIFTTVLNAINIFNIQCGLGCFCGRGIMYNEVNVVAVCAINIRQNINRVCHQLMI